MDKKRKNSFGKQCASFGCKNREYNSDGSRSEYHFFTFPTKNPRRNIWCNKVKRKHGRDGFKVTKNTVICDQHFNKTDIYRSPGGIRCRLKKDALPSIFIWTDANIMLKRKPPKQRSSLFPASSKSRSTCSSTPLEQENQKSLEEESETTCTLSTDTEMDSTQLFEENPCFMQDQSCQTDWSIPVMQPVETEHSYSFSFNPEACSNQQDYINSMIERLEVKSEMINNLRSELGKIKKELDEYKQRTFCVENYKEDDAAMQFYTGFPNYSSFLAFFTYLEPKVAKLQYWGGPEKADHQRYQEEGRNKPGRKRTMTPVNELFMILVRLKVGLLVKDLSDRFCISIGQFSKIFCTWINFLYFELLQLFPFPSQKDIQRNMPSQFNLYPTTRVIIDCTEVFVQVPSSMLAQSQTWSNYKHHNTFKVLVGISPNGQVIFISQLWGGRVSDKLITLQSGILDYLEVGDNVMADRGYDIADILPPGVGLNIPPFKGSRDQLTAEEVQETVHIASVRIHVERAIGRVKNFHILD